MLSQAVLLKASSDAFHCRLRMVYDQHPWLTSVMSSNWQKLTCSQQAHHAQVAV